MKLSVVIPARIAPDVLRACLDSLRPAVEGKPEPPVTSMEVIVVDDGSPNELSGILGPQFPNVRFLRNDRNLGFAATANKGLIASTGDYIALLNSDTVVPRGGLERLVGFLLEHPDVWAVGPRLRYPSGGVQPSCSTFIRLRDVLFEQFFLDKMFPKSHLFGGHFLTWWSYDEPREVDVISGACIVASRETWRRVGLLDENYFLYCDDPDWCLRVKRAGGRCWFYPDVEITHHVGATSAGRRGPAILAYNRSRCYYFLKHHGMKQAVWARRIAIAGAVFRLALWGTAALLGMKRARDQTAVWRQVLRGLFEINLRELAALQPAVPTLP
ncbi:MAG: glycosyltransferase family 2 protein [Armatimonadota bacterium]